MDTGTLPAGSERAGSTGRYLWRTFENRSGRVVAVGRAVLALYFVFVLWADPRQPEVHQPAAELFLGGYAVASAAYVVAAWNRWWLEARLSLPFHAIDLALFAALNYVTSGYASPFFLFFVFILLSSSLRWGWGEILATAAALIAIYAVEGVSASTWGTEAFDLERFLLRVMYMVVFTALMLLWFASRSAAVTPIMAPEIQPKGAEDFFRASLAGIAARLTGSSAVAIWSDEEEPWRYVVSLAVDGQVSTERLEPDALDPVVSPAAGEAMMIYDCARGAVLRGRWPRAKPEAIAQPITEEVAARYDVAKGIRIPLRSGGIDGELLVGGIKGLSLDDLGTAAAVHEEVCGALERAELVHANERAAIMRARLSFARDVHDGMVQFLAGVALRLEGLKKEKGAAAVADIEDLQAELAREQQDLRAMIRRLKGGGITAGVVDAAASLKPLAERLARQWGIQLSVEEPETPVLVDSRLETEIHNLVREAAANAARHGGARRVAVVLDGSGDRLRLRISDDGRGLAQSGRFDHADIAARRIGPRSIFDRVQQRGGTLDIESGASGTRLSILLPAGGVAA